MKKDEQITLSEYEINALKELDKSLGFNGIKYIQLVEFFIY